MTEFDMNRELQVFVWWHDARRMRRAGLFDDANEAENVAHALEIRQLAPRRALELETVERAALVMMFAGMNGR